MRFSSKLGYGVGQISDGAKTVAFSTFLFFYYNQVLGLSGTLAGLVSLLALVVDAVTDPMVGQYSDRLRSRWGRRHPLMLVGAIPFGFAMAMLFSPPEGLNEYGLFSWMLGGAIIVRLLLTLFFVPHLSLGAELGREYDQHTSIIGYRVFFSYIGQLLTAGVGFIFFFPPTETYPNGMLNGSSYPAFGVFVGLLASSSMLWSVFSTRSVIPYLTKPVHNPKARSAILAVTDVFLTLRQRSFRIVFFTTLAFMVLGGVTQTLLVYVATYLFGFAPEHLALVASSSLLGIVFASIIAQTLIRRIDKKNVLAVCVSIGALFASLPLGMYLVGVFQLQPLEQKVGLVFLSNGISQAFFIAYVIVLDSMLSDTIDENELYNGRREEGLFFSARSLATKASYGLGSFFAGVALDIIAFPQAANPQDVPLEALQSLAWLSGPISMTLFVLTIVVSRRYSLSAKRHRDILQRIDENRLHSGLSLSVAHK